MSGALGDPSMQTPSAGIGFWVVSMTNNTYQCRAMVRERNASRQCSRRSGKHLSGVDAMFHGLCWQHAFGSKGYPDWLTREWAA